MVIFDSLTSDTQGVSFMSYSMKIYREGHVAYNAILYVALHEQKLNINYTSNNKLEAVGRVNNRNISCDQIRNHQYLGMDNLFIPHFELDIIT